MCLEIRRQLANEVVMCSRHGTFTKLNGAACYDSFQNVCVEKSMRNEAENVNVVNNTSLDLDCPDFLVNSIEHNRISNQAFVKIGIGNTCVRMKFDTGAQVNVISRSQYMALNIKGPLQYTYKRFSAYGGKAL
jgi:hypothetical protein